MYVSLRRARPPRAIRYQVSEQPVALGPGYVKHRILSLLKTSNWVKTGSVVKDRHDFSHLERCPVSVCYVLILAGGDASCYVDLSGSTMRLSSALNLYSPLSRVELGRAYIQQTAS